VPERELVAQPDGQLDLPWETRSTAMTGFSAPTGQCVTGRGVHPQRRADVAAADLPAHDRGVRAAYRPRRLSPRADRRRDRRM